MNSVLRPRVAMDFDDAEKTLRAAVGNLRGWTFEQFQEMAGAEQSSIIESALGRSYVFAVDVTDLSGDYDSTDELLELEFTLSELPPWQGFAARNYVKAVTRFRRGEAFPADAVQVFRTTARTEGLLALAFAAFLGLVAGLLVYRCTR